MQWVVSEGAKVKKFDGSNWVDVDLDGLPEGFVGYTTIAIDGNDNPYIVYGYGLNWFKAAVKKYNGSSWEDVGMPRFSAGIAVLHLLVK